MIDPALQNRVLDWLASLWLWFQDNVLEPERLIELAALALGLWAGRLIARFLWRALDTALSQDKKWEKLPHMSLTAVLFGLASLVLLWSARLSLEPFIGALYILPLATSLLAAWVVIQGLVAFISNRELRRMAGVAIWTLAALNILGLLPAIIAVLDGAVLPVGDKSVSVLDVLMGLITFGLLIWLALAASAMIENRLRAMETLPQSAAVLIGKTIRFLLLALALLVSLNASGIDLTALAVFGGALGVGIGFGLQKVVGNFISGLILLIDRSIKPGDVIEIGQTYGRINKMAARYTSVITRDDTEFLIPNEDMITQPVVNWSHSHRLVRRRVPLQVAYNTDLDQAMALMIDAAREEVRVQSTPEPKVLLKAFGPDGIDLELRMWITDPQNGVSNIASAVMLRIWTKFKDAGIEFPFPQRVVHIARDDWGQLPDSLA